MMFEKISKTFGCGKTLECLEQIKLLKMGVYLFM